MTRHARRVAIAAEAHAEKETPAEDRDRIVDAGRIEIARGIAREAEGLDLRAERRIGFVSWAGCVAAAKRQQKQALSG